MNPACQQDEPNPALLLARLIVNFPTQHKFRRCLIIFHPTVRQCCLLQGTKLLRKTVTKFDKLVHVPKYILAHVTARECAMSIHVKLLFQRAPQECY